MLIELRDGHWENLQGVKKMYISRAKILETGETKWHVIFEIGEYYNVSSSDVFETRDEAKAFAEKIAAKLNGENFKK